MSFPATCHPPTHVFLIPFLSAKLQSLNWHLPGGLALCHRFGQDQDLGPGDFCRGRRFLTYLKPKKAKPNVNSKIYFGTAVMYSNCFFLLPPVKKVMKVAEILWLNIRI